MKVLPKNPVAERGERSRGTLRSAAIRPAAAFIYLLLLELLKIKLKVSK